MTARFAGSLLVIASIMTQAGLGQAHYKQVDVLSNVPGLALHVDPGLVDPWGLAVSGSQAFRIANGGTGIYKSYDQNGLQQLMGGTVAPAANQVGFSKVTGIASNTTGLFVPRGSLSSPFLFATANGTISGEYADANGDILLSTILVVDSSASGAVYTGLAVLSPSCCAPYLAVANFHAGEINTFTSLFQPLGIPGAFIDPNLPAGYAPYNLNVVGNQIFVTYAVQDANRQNAVAGAGRGIVDIYDLAGAFVRRFASNGALNAPWAVVQASANFGEFSNDILIGNSGDGVINAFDPTTGQLAGQLRDGSGNTIVNLNLHGMSFGTGVTGDLNTLYLTAGLAGGTDGLFAAIAVNSGAAPDFALAPSTSTGTLAGGQPATFSVTATPIGDFRGLFTFSCNAPSTVTCSVGSTAVNAFTGAATVTVTVTTSPMAEVTRSGSPWMAGMLIAGIGGWRLRRMGGKKGKARASFLLLAFVLAGLGFAGMSGCSSGMKGLQAPPANANVVITATTGSLSHNTTVTLALQ